MCTLVVLRRLNEPWPLILAANRDEMADRPWLPPARHWPDRPGVVAGLDILGGGTWLGCNDHLVVAAVLNRLNTLGPAPGRRSRGELPLVALDHDTARAAAEALADLDPNAYRAFNLLVADAREAFWIRSVPGDDAATADAKARIGVHILPEGLSMITAYDANDPASPRIRRYRPRFAAAPPPRPAEGAWDSWIRLLADREHDPGSGPGGGMTVVTETGFGTVSSSLLAVPDPAVPAPRRRPVWLFAAGRPADADFLPVEALERPL